METSNTDTHTEMQIAKEVADDIRIIGLAENLSRIARKTRIAGQINGTVGVNVEFRTYGAGVPDEFFDVREINAWAAQVLITTGVRSWVKYLDPSAVAGYLLGVADTLGGEA